MDKPRVITDHKWHYFKYASEVPAKVLASDFDYQNRDDVVDSFFCYRGCWYHMDMFTRCKHTPGWDGYHIKRRVNNRPYGDSFFSGVLIKLSRDCEQYQVATIISTMQLSLIC